MTDIFVTGIGTTTFVKAAGRSAGALGAEAATAAIADAGVTPDRIEAVFGGSARATAAFSQRVVGALGLYGVPAVNVENACASGATALAMARDALRAGTYETVLVVGADTLSAGGGGPIVIEEEDRIEAPALTYPAWYALKAARLIHERSLSIDDLAAVAVKNRRHAVLNPIAQQRTEVSIADVLNSRPVSWPLTLLQCCPASDGGAAVVLSRAAHAGSDRRIRLLGVGLASGRPHQSGSDASRVAARAAFEEAGIDPRDVAVAEVHDAFTVSEIIYSEELGFYPAGEGVRGLRDGETALGGRRPISPSGGLIGRGHPPGATGLAQVAEIVAQLRGRAGARQVSGANIGATQVAGASIPHIDSNAACVCVLAA